MDEADLQVNAETHRVERAPERSLLSVLREDLGLTGTKQGCGEGACGACTVLLDGEARLACQVSLAEALGHAVTSIEGLARDGELHAVQRAFLAEGALQCGFCTPGMILSAVALLARQPDPSAAEIRRALDGNLCRCGGYPRIVRAVQRASRDARGAER